MKRTILPALAACAAAASLAAPALAQGVAGVNIQAEVPFEFVVGGKTFPPGTYEVETIQETEDAPVLTIQRSDVAGNGDLRYVNVATTPVRQSDTEERPKLVFVRVGDMNFLDKVVPTQGIVREVED